MIPIGILGSAYKASGLAPTRSKWATGQALSGAGSTVTFDEPTALGSTFLLIAAISASSNATPAAAGWTSIATGGATARRTVIYALRGDGSTNSVTVTAGGGTADVSLTAWPGYSSLTPIAIGGGAPTTASFPMALASTPAGNGVCIGALKTASPGAIGTWSNGYTELAREAFFAAAAWRRYDGTNADVTMTVTGNTLGAWVLAALPLI